MVQKLAKKPTDKATAPDRGETISAMEPMVVSESSRHRGRLNELVFHLTTAATGLKTSLPDGMVEAVGDLVRLMNCYYSNLIEGRNTHPIDIERALAEGFGRREAVVPGALRTSDVQVGRHIAVSPGAVPRFLARWQEVYQGLSRFETVLQAASAHRRLLWIHPFSDGNGHVARLVSYADGQAGRHATAGHLHPGTLEAWPGTLQGA
jgi:Fic/DOC family